MPKPSSRSASTEVVASPENDRRQRRRWTKEDKLRIVAEAEACEERGQIGALLRREGLYSSLLHRWRQELRDGGSAVASSTRRKPRDLREEELERLRRKLAKTERELKVANAVIELQKKAQELLGLASPTETMDERSALNSSETETPSSR